MLEKLELYWAFWATIDHSFKIFPEFARPLFKLQENPGENGGNPLKTRPTKLGVKKGQLPSKTPVQWTSEHSAVVARLVDMLTSSPILAYPDFNLPFVLHTDASNEGLGAVLYQEQGGKLRSNCLWLKVALACREELSPPFQQA